MNTQFTSLTIEINKLLTKTDKKNNGIFFTPKTIIEKLTQELLSYISQKNIQIKTILEPSCGSCEIVLILNKLFNNSSIDAIELNHIIFEKINIVLLK